MTPGEKLLALMKAVRDAQTLVERRRAENELYGFARELTHRALGSRVSESDFDDIGQHVCLQLSKGKCREEIPGAAMSWLRTVATNEYRTMLRRHREPPDGYVATIEPPEPPDTPEEREKKEQRALRLLRSKVLLAARDGQQRAIRLFLADEVDGKGPVLDGLTDQAQINKARQNHYKAKERGREHFAEVASRLAPLLTEMQLVLARKLSGDDWLERLPEGEPPETGDGEDRS